ncbi:MAG: PBP1A family penicillin-binding protein [Hyphomicrobiaceae bacterium]
MDIEPAPEGEAAVSHRVDPGTVAPRQIPWRRRWYVRAAIQVPLYAAALATILVSVQLIRYTIQFPDPHALTVNQPGPTLRILARDGSVLADRGDRNDFIPLDQLPRHLVDAVIAIEDRRFFSHWGVDPAGLVRAALANLRAGRATQGGSTLTQQLAKNLFLSTERTLGRKLEEAVLALWLEVRLSKREILELYLNRVYFGGGSYGVEAAARRFFNKSARSVNVAEAAVIAGLLKAPSKFSPFANPGYARARARVVIRAMLAARLISPVSSAAAVRQSVHFAAPEVNRQANGLEYAVDYVLDRLPPLASISKRMVVVETTIDPDVQRRAQAAVTETLAKEGSSAKAGQGAAIVLDTSGGIRALVGGRSFAESQFNRAVKAHRQPGSAFKPFVYVAALENGLWPDTPVTDSPIEIGEWSPRNDDGRYRGPLTLTQALAHSVNTVAVRLQQQIGGDKVVNVARRLGITSPLRPDASMALGTSEVGLLELCGAYATLAAGGLAVEPFVITRMRTADGEVIFERREPGPRMVVAPDTIGAINTMLNAAIVSGTGRRAAFPRHQAAGKTGTTQDFRDAWFVGYTAHLVAGVWLGNDDSSPMNHVTGGSLPARVWRDVMQSAHASLTPRALPAVGASVLDPTRVPESVDRLPVARLPVRRHVPVIAASVTSEISSTTTTAAEPASDKIAIPRPSPARVVREARDQARTTAATRTKVPAFHSAKARISARSKALAATGMARRSASPAKSLRPATQRMPTSPIDPELFTKAMAAGASPSKPLPKADDPPSTGASFDPDRIRDALQQLRTTSPPRMSLGVGPTG